MADADNFESSPFSAAIMVVSYIHALGMQDSETQYDEFLHKYEIIFNYPEENDASNVSAKYSCGFPDPQVFPIIVAVRYLDYFTTIMEDRLWQVLAKPVCRWRNRSG